jgi:hypothetical protein
VRASADGGGVTKAGSTVSRRVRNVLGLTISSRAACAPPASTVIACVPGDVEIDADERLPLAVADGKRLNGAIEGADAKRGGVRRRVDRQDHELAGLDAPRLDIDGQRPSRLAMARRRGRLSIHRRSRDGCAAVEQAQPGGADGQSVFSHVSATRSLPKLCCDTWLTQTNPARL